MYKFNKVILFILGYLHFIFFVFCFVFYLLDFQLFFKHISIRYGSALELEYFWLLWWLQDLFCRFLSLQILLLINFQLFIKFFVACIFQPCVLGSMLADLYGEKFGYEHCCLSWCCPCAPLLTRVGMKDIFFNTIYLFIN